jgi:heptose-I-phosphate ethanolaminephosphotransferase
LRYKINDYPLKVNSKLILLFIISFFLSTIYGPIGAVLTEYISYSELKKEFKGFVKARMSGLNTPFDIIQNGGPNKIVIIIGESLNRNYMSLYGFEENTTPNLLKLSSDTLEGRLIYFNDIISTEVTTVKSLQKVLTTVTENNEISFFDSFTIIDLFNKAGYKSFWLSNDYPLGEFHTSTSVIANSADSVYFTISKKSLKARDIIFEDYHDGDLIEVFDNIISYSDPQEKQIFFLHLLGSHQSYEDKYPLEFNHFKSKDKNKDHYLNSVLYNDWVINQFIEIAKKNDVGIVSYFSDHGEDIIYGHNPENFTNDMCEIPFMFYLSDSYVSNNPDLYNRLIERTEMGGTSTNFIHDIQELSGVKASFFDSSLSLISNDFIKKERYVLNDRVLYSPVQLTSNY